MSNILDYIKWRGDLSIRQSSFNGIDSLILSRFSYLPFESIMKNDETITIEELGKRFSNKSAETMNILLKFDTDLLPLLGPSKRFGEMYATDYANAFEPEIEKQFSAITVLMPDNLMYVAFRGTDDTMVGWKEDFNLSFKSHTSSQISSKNYLNAVAEKFPERNIIVGGHSKGGNLAIYSAAFCNQNVKNRIIRVFNNDGPGFCEDIIESDEYKSILNKIHTFIPESSVIGRLMNHKENYSVVKSTQKGIMQHDLYSWQVLGNSFVLSKVPSNKSDYIDKTITQWVNEFQPEEREQFIDVVYQILCKTNAKTISELKKNWFKNSKIVLRNYKNTDEKTKKIINEVFSGLVKSATGNALSK